MHKESDLSDEAAALVESDRDLYALLGLVESNCDAKAIKSAWRQTSLKYHPDKNPNNPAVVETFYLAKHATELLLHPSGRGRYDARREARKLHEAQVERMEGQRRRLRDELERAERGAKKRREGAKSSGGFEGELKRLARDGERRRRDREEARARERAELEHRETRHGADMRIEAGIDSVSDRGRSPATNAAAEDVAKSVPIVAAAKRPFFSFSPRSGSAGKRFEQDTLARLRAKQAERQTAMKLAEQVRAQETEKTDVRTSDKTQSGVSHNEM